MDDNLDIGELRVFKALFHRSVIKVSRPPGESMAAEGCLPNLQKQPRSKCDSNGDRRNDIFAATPIASAGRVLSPIPMISAACLARCR